MKRLTLRRIWAVTLLSAASVLHVHQTTDADGHCSYTFSNRPLTTTHTHTDRFGEKVGSYDRNGNILNTRFE